MDNSALVKYYDPRTGKYEFATVLDVGDLSKLNTTIKTDLVSAINSLEGNGWGGGGEVPPGLIDELENIKDAIASIKDGTFIIEEWGSFDQYFQSGIADAIEQLNIFNREQIVITVEEIESAIQESKDYYDQHLAETMQDVESARTDMANAQQTLNETAQRLEEADLNYSEVTLKVDEIDQYIEGNIKSVKFDIVSAVVTEYESLVRQMEDEFGVNVEESFLSYLTGRVGKAESDISVQSGKIENKVGYDEFQYMPVEDIDQYNKNLLFHTMDFSESWERNDVRAYVSTDSFRHTRIIAMDISNAYYSSITDTLELGKTYTLSASFNIQPLVKAPNEDRFAPTDGNYEVSAFIDGTEYPMVDLVENLTGINGFKRLSVSFVSENENPEVYFRIKNLNAETSTGYMTAPKLEAGNKSTPWQPHFDDEYATMLSTNSLVRQQGNEIVSLISSNKELGDKFVTATSSFQQLEDGFIRNAELIEEYEDAVVRYGMEVEELNDRITQKVWMDDFSDAVETISIDGKNRVLNSDFVDVSTDNSQLVLGSWENVDPLFTIEKIDGINYAVIKRARLTGNLVASMASNRFAVKNGERLMFGFDIIVETMPDVGNVFQIELLDINDIRVGLESFTLDQMDGDITLGEVSRLNYQYIINREDVAKARVRLMLTRNGHVKFTRVMAQQGTIKDTEWSPAPEDAQILRMKMQTEINQTAEQIQLLANDERLDAINDILYRKEGRLEVSPSEILARVTSSELGDDAVVTGTQLKLTEEDLRFDLVGKDGLIQSINASEEGLKIDFDRVEVNGLLLAQIISTQYLDVSEGFKIMHGSNMVLGIHPQTGELTLNVPKLTINARPVATQEDLENIELTPGPKGEDGIAGRGISSIVEQFYLSNSKTTQTGGSWSTTMPTWSPGKYVWTRSYITYTTGTPATGTTTPLVSSEWEAINEIEIGSTNLLKNSKTITLSSNNHSLYPTSVTQTEEGGRTFSRLRRTNLNSEPLIFSIYSTMSIESINSSIFENESTVVSFKARASQNVTMSVRSTTYGGSPIVTGNSGDINVTTEWKTFYSIFPKIPKSASGFRVNPLQTITGVTMSTFYLDLCEWKIEKGNKPTDWSPAPEDVQSSIDLKADSSATETALNDAAAKLQVLQQEVEAAATANELNDFIDKYNKDMASRDSAVRESESSLSSALTSITSIQNNLGDMSETWTFIDRFIKNTPQGVVVGNDSSGSYILIKEDRLSFYSNGQEVAFISQNLMEISRGAFVEQIQIAKYQFEESTTNHLTIRYVG